MIRRIALGIEYNGSGFSGWQRQKHAISVQECCENALTKVADHEVILIAAGRTDKGVHAVQQVAHFSTFSERSAIAWVQGVNANLPATISILWALEVADSFHARYSAYSRTYRYCIYNDIARPALYAGQLSWRYGDLDITMMKQACQYLIGEHDFSSFRASECQARSPVRHVYSLEIQNFGPLIVFQIIANAFLQQMVRTIVGTLLEVGRGKHSPVWVKDVLHARDRNCAGATARADGLCLYDVSYPPEYRLPAPASMHFSQFANLPSW